MDCNVFYFLCIVFKWINQSMCVLEKSLVIHNFENFEILMPAIILFKCSIKTASAKVQLNEVTTKRCIEHLRTKTPK